MSVPRSPSRGGRRAGEPQQPHRACGSSRRSCCGGYGQFSYGFNYWGPTGDNRDTYVLVQEARGARRAY